MTPMLLERGAIPDVRLSYFDDPAYNRGKKSRMDIFEGNGTSGKKIFSHGNFLKHLRYLIHGADLPDHVKAEVAEAVGEPSYFTGDDLEPIQRLARRLVRSMELRMDYSDAFFQLMIDIGVGPDHAESVRKTVKTVK